MTQNKGRSTLVILSIVLGVFAIGLTMGAAPAHAKADLQTGAFSNNRDLSPPHAAALAVVANALMNTDEAYMRR